MTHPTVVQFKSTTGSGNGSPPGVVTLNSAPTSGNLLIATVGIAPAASVTVDTTKWTQFESQTNMFAVYRYVQGGDAAALPAFCTAGNTYWAAAVYEINNVTGVFATDVLQHESGHVSSTSVAITTMTTTVANQLGLVGYAQYNGTSLNNVSAGWTDDTHTNDFGNYGIIGECSQLFASSSSSVDCTVTSNNSGHLSYMALLTSGDSSTAYTLTAAEGTYSLSGKTANQSQTRTAAKGTYNLTGQSAILGHGYFLTARQGTYHLHGKSVSKVVARKLLADWGSYRVHKEIVVLQSSAGAATIFPVDAGLYALTGQDAVFGQEFLRLTFAEFGNSDYLDWETTSGADYSSYLNTAYVVPSDAATWTFVPYLYVFLENGSSADDVSLLLKVVKDWAETGNTPKEGADIQVYRYRNGYAVSTSKNRVRGKGRVMQLQFRSEEGKAFNLRGWALWIEKNGLV